MARLFIVAFACLLMGVILDAWVHGDSCNTRGHDYLHIAATLMWGFGIGVMGGFAVAAYNHIGRRD